MSDGFGDSCGLRQQPCGEQRNLKGPGRNSALVWLLWCKNDVRYHPTCRPCACVKPLASQTFSFHQPPFIPSNVATAFFNKLGAARAPWTNLMIILLLPTLLSGTYLNDRLLRLPTLLDSVDPKLAFTSLIVREYNPVIPWARGQMLLGNFVCFLDAKWSMYI
jgi:hypothetical protein